MRNKLRESIVGKGFRPRGIEKMSGGESSSDQGFGGYQIRGRRWVTKE